MTLIGLLNDVCTPSLSLLLVLGTGGCRGESDTAESQGDREGEQGSGTREDRNEWRKPSVSLEKGT